jgi:hypothetical protein
MTSTQTHTNSHFTIRAATPSDTPSWIDTPPSDDWSIGLVIETTCCRNLLVCLEHDGWEVFDSFSGIVICDSGDTPGEVIAEAIERMGEDEWLSLLDWGRDSAGAPTGW